jgi:hypothetical protein
LSLKNTFPEALCAKSIFMPYFLSKISNTLEILLLPSMPRA